MSNSKSVEFVKHIYGDIGALPTEDEKTRAEKRHDFLKHIHPEVQWTVNGPASLSKCGMWKGKEGVMQFLMELDKCWVFEQPITIIDAIEMDDPRTVVVTSFEKGHYLDTKIPFMAKSTQLWNFSPEDKDGVRLVLGFTEHLCVWAGEEEIKKMPPIVCDPPLSGKDLVPQIDAGKDEGIKEVPRAAKKAKTSAQEG